MKTNWEEWVRSVIAAKVKDAPVAIATTIRIYEEAYEKMIEKHEKAISIGLEAIHLAKSDI